MTMNNSVKRYLALALCAVIIACTFASCASGSTKSVNVTIIDEISVSENGRNKIDLSATVKVHEKTNAGECFRNLCNTSGVLVEGIDKGFVQNIGGVKNSGNYAWMFFINGELSADAGISDYIPKDGDSISFMYVDYTMLVPAE